MTVLSGFELPMEEARFFEEQGEALRRPTMQEAAREGLAQAAGLVDPAIVYDWFPVTLRGRTEAEIGGLVFHLGRHANLLDRAQSAFVAVVSIGLRLETEARELQASGKALASYMVDAAGVFVVGLLLEKARHIAEQEAAGRGWGVGAELAPGQLSGWAISEQLLVGQLLDLGSIGVRVTESGMLVPQKSASIVVGIGPEYESSEVCTPCEFCDVSETCRFRH
jgi:hypothetical protein